MSFDGIQLESKILAWRQILEKSTTFVCSSVSSRESVRIAFIIVVLSKLDFHIAIIGNLYVNVVKYENMNLGLIQASKLSWLEPLVIRGVYVQHGKHGWLVK